jgi:hypothetical protein
MNQHILNICLHEIKLNILLFLNDLKNKQV